MRSSKTTVSPRQRAMAYDNNFVRCGIFWGEQGSAADGTKGFPSVTSMEGGRMRGTGFHGALFFSFFLLCFSTKCVCVACLLTYMQHCFFAHHVLFSFVFLQLFFIGTYLKIPPVCHVQVDSMIESISVLQISL